MALMNFREEHRERSSSEETVSTYQTRSNTPESIVPTNENHTSKKQPQCRVRKSDLQFVNLFGTQKPDEHDRSTVKSHVMRRVWKKHKDSQANWVKRKQPPPVLRKKGDSKPVRDISPPDSPLTGIHSPATSNFRSQTYSDTFQTSPQLTPITGQFAELSTSDHQPESVPAIVWPGEFVVSPRLAAAIRGGDSDPFGAFPVPFTSRLHQLIHHEATNATRTSVHEDDNDTLASHTGSCKALLYVTLSWVAAKLDGGSLNGNFESTFYLQSSVAAVNSDLNNAHRNGLTDGTIAAVACMTNMENLSGDRSSALIHLNGLHQMINIRGGLDTLPPILQRLVLWTDLLNATSWKSIPRFPLLDFSHLQPLSTFLPHTIQRAHLTINEALIRDALQTDNAEILPLLHDCHQLGHFLDHTPPKDIALMNAASFSDRVYTVEYQLLQLLNRNTNQLFSQTISDTSSYPSIITPFLHALLLYTYTNLRLTPVGDQIRCTLVTGVISSLKQSDLSSLNQCFPKQLIWILFLGATAAVPGSEERTWFKEQLWWAMVVNCWHDFEWMSIGMMLRNMMWLENEFYRNCQMLWEEVLE